VRLQQLFGEAEGFSLSLAKKTPNGNLDDVSETVHMAGLGPKTARATPRLRDRTITPSWLARLLLQT